ncbi:hypothetical protein FB554_0521 [Barrientosiimonas humi]|uniref:YgjP-like metallopeptidase domain-containing protein n=1 Tax=Barrientosiimonas humi TaxID=999931 RepID=A0A542X978_9MICO|nr:M48 family metallopeptidase [Barrientosiimonas humi]TQL32397.1 hypothetical protein FB554_0521 [Barrientosiimonas humi]CAG7572388.1 hypothetical protein BH39T_PBIAJDOK_01002 [Barrientosiimonas humi]
MNQQLPFESGRPAPAEPEFEVEIRRSARRKRSVSARLEGGRIIVMVPDRLSAREEQRYVDDMVAKITARTRRSRFSDADLARRAEQLSRTYLAGTARPAGVRWVTNQNSRWGSCTPATRQIRLSHRLQGMPQEVVDYVLLHELAHLLVPRHGPRFWALLEGYPHLERAKGFLEGVAHAEHRPEPFADDVEGVDGAD